MSVIETAFSERYNKLNQQQRNAVDTVYGPVMVIAGPGTGKTEVLSMRIANLLRSEAQVQPNEILCLTYTDEATNAMCRRLLQIIGPAAHRVNIGTFHAFCNNVIQNNSEYFSLRSLTPITDLERSALLYKIIEDLPKGHELRRLSGNIYFDASKLNRLFDMMKRENISAKDIQAAADEYLASLPSREEFKYKRAGKGYQKGDLKQALIDDELRKMNDTKAAAALFDVYTQKMRDHGWYDFNDMILWVLQAFKDHPVLLQNYQERHQFILVDEFQDTNGAQNELLKLLTDFWEDDPNIFVVGDDDQSIYEFQGARIKNIVEFYGRYKEKIKVIVLPQNYRSSQAILDKALLAIDNNEQRLIKQLTSLNLDKNIVAASERFADGRETVAPVIREYINLLHEEADIVMQIEELQKEGIPLNHVAILYAQHKQADNIIALLERKNIPYSVKKPVNILDMPHVDHILKLLEYLVKEHETAFSGEALLFEMMHTPCYGIDAVDIASLSLYMAQNKTKDKSLGYWRMLISHGMLLQTLGLKSATAIMRLGSNINSWLTQLNELPLPLLVEKLIYESGIVQHLSATKEFTWNIQVLNTFYDYVKEAYGRTAYKITAAKLLDEIGQMRLENIAIPVQKVVHAENGVQLYTAHGAKGNEFEYVFLVGCTKNYWESKRGGGNEYKLPDTITRTEEDKDKTYKTEVARRLFYVALTRAKKHLHISYAASDNNNKPLEHSLFIDEICSEHERVRTAVSEEDIVEHIKWAMQPVPEVRIRLANHQWIERVLQQFTMSATSLSRYISCPVAFYYEQVLKVPFQKNDALAFGSAIHYALERFYREMKMRGRVFPTKEELLGYFDFGMSLEASCFSPVQYERRQEQGHVALDEYYEQYINEFAKDVEVEYKIPRYLLDGVPVTGKIDKIEFEGDTCQVVDYKTGDPDKSAAKYTQAPSDENKDGGDYWRQMVFYKLLIENYKDRNWRVSMGTFDFVQRGFSSRQFRRISVPVFAQDEEIVRVQLKDSYTRIMNHEFEKGCGKEDCRWCNFARRYELVRSEEVPEIDDV